MTRPPVRSRAIVTGASSGIGRAIAERLAADGAHVLLVARSIEDLILVRDEIRGRGGRAKAFAADLTDRSAADAVVAFARAALGGVDILVNCASATRNADFFDITDDEWALGFEVKVLGAIRLSRSAWPALRESAGSIVNICGIGARTPRAEGSMTGALSASLGAITKALADRGVVDGVQVNAINPGLIQTPRIEKTWMEAYGLEAAAALDRKVRERGATRVGRPDDVAALVAYIVSPAGDLLQGAIIDLDGGATKGL